MRKPYRQRLAARRWRRRHREHVKRTNAAYWSAHKEAINGRRRLRVKDLAAWFDAGMSVVTSAGQRKPCLLYVDARGAVHFEEELSAEELIRRYQEATCQERKSPGST